MNLDERNYYEILGLNRDAGAADIEAAFQRIYARYAADDLHPPALDLEHIHHAYDVLRDPQRRQLYDGLLAEVDEPIAIHLQVSSQELPLIDAPQMLYLFSELRPRKVARQEVLPLNICLVVDCSTSMRGERLQRVKSALALLLSNLSSADFLSVVTFSDRADVVLPPQPVGKHEDPAQWLEDIKASGGTEIYHGLLSGMKQLHKVSLNEYNNHLLLLTDGRTYGDEEHCLNLAREAARQDITIHAFGIGSDWDDSFLDALVDPSTGLVAYIDEPGKIVSALQEKLLDLGNTYAHQVRLLADWPQSIELLEGFLLTPYAQPLRSTGGELLLGALEGGGALSFLLAFVVKPQPIATRIRIPLKITAELPGRGTQTFQEQIQLSISAGASQEQPPEDILHAARLLTLYHLHERAWREAEAGQTAEAVRHMRHLSTRLLESGETELALQADLQAKQLIQTGNLSEAGHKKLKYGTRALARKTLQLDWDD